MSIIIKTPEEIELMSESGKILHEILYSLKEKVVPGIKTYELDRYSEEMFEKFDVIATFKGYQGFPASICTAVNEEIVHSIPGNRILNDGDIISIDAGVTYKGMITDSAITIRVGKVEESTEEFVKTCEKALVKGLAVIKPGIHLIEIGGAIQDEIEKNGYSIVKDLIGHGVGKQLHEDPEIPNFRTKNKGPILEAGMTFAIEPIVAMGSGRMETLEDNWTIVTKDRSLAAQAEHTVVVTDNGHRVLT
jgi:methionyl aminopeptidase